MLASSERMSAPPRVGCMVEPLVRLGRTIPGEILLHRLPAHLLDVRGSVEPRRERPADDVIESAGREILEGEARARTGAFVVLDDRVGEPAGRPHDGERAVAKAVELIQAARLEPRRHEEEIRSRLDAVRPGGVEADERAEAIRTKP